MEVVEAEAMAGQKTVAIRRSTMVVMAGRGVVAQSAAEPLVSDWEHGD